MGVPPIFYMTSTEPAKIMGTFKRVTYTAVNGTSGKPEESLAAANWTNSAQCWLEDFYSNDKTTEGSLTSETIASDEVNVAGESFGKLVCRDGYIIQINQLHDFGEDGYHTAIEYVSPDDEVLYAIRGSDSYSEVRLMCKTDTTGNVVTGVRVMFYQTYPDVDTGNMFYLSEAFPQIMIDSLIYKDESGGPGGPGVQPGGPGSGTTPQETKPAIPTTSGNFIITEFNGTLSTAKPEDLENSGSHPESWAYIVYDLPASARYDYLGAYLTSDGRNVKDNTTEYNDKWQANQEFFKIGSSLVHFDTSTDSYTDAIDLPDEYLVSADNIINFSDTVRIRRAGNIFRFEHYLEDNWMLVDDWRMTVDPTTTTSAGGSNFVAYLCRTSDDEYFILSYSFKFSSDSYKRRNSYITRKVLNSSARNLLNGLVEDVVIDPNTNNNTSDNDPYEDNQGNAIPDGDRGGKGNDETVDGRRDETPGDPVADSNNLDGGMSTGFFRIYNPTKAELQSLSTEMNAGSAWTELKKFFTNDPMEGLISLHLIPTPIPADSLGSIEHIKIGNFTSEVSMHPILKRYITFDFGTQKLQQCYPLHEYLNYDPHTKVSINLPYIGVQPLNTDDVMGRNCQLKYTFDIITGAVVAILYIQYNGTWHPRYMWNGTAIAKLPLTGRNHNELISSLMNSAKTVMANTITGNVAGVATGLAGAAQGLGHVNVEFGGAFSGQAGWMGSKQAYFIVTNPVVRWANSYAAELGLPSNETKTVGQLCDSYNYMKFTDIDVNGIAATSDELDMLKNLLQGGVYSE